MRAEVLLRWNFCKNNPQKTIFFENFCKLAKEKWFFATSSFCITT
jgi:hypothetical protein